MIANRAFRILAGLSAFTVCVTLPGCTDADSASAASGAEAQAGTTKGDAKSPMSAAQTPPAARLALAQPAEVPAAPRQAPVADRSAMAGVQDRILGASKAALTSRDFTGFEQIERQLRGMDAGGSAQARYYRDYWLGFLLYEKSVAYMQTDRRDEAKAALQQSISTLEAVTPRDSETNALLGLATGLNLQFVPRQSIMNAIGDVNAYLAASLQKPSLRSYYAGAISDWNTPVQYGGQKKAELLARQALAQPEKRLGGISPTWGRDLATVLLVKILRAQKKTGEAQALHQKAKHDFPDSVALRQLEG
jgi:hypothetical protein